MNPIAPAPVNQTPQGVSSVAPVAAPTPSALPQAPVPGAAPAPVAQPQLDTQGAMSAIANYYQIPRQTAEVVKQGQVQANAAQSQVDTTNFQAKVKQQQLQDSLDPSKYKIIKDPNKGGITIVNSLGDKIDIGTYTNLTGANPADVLKNSTNPDDIKFVQAYNNLQDFTQNKIAAQNGDVQAQAKLADYYKANPGLQNIELGQLSQAFMGQYGSYFGMPSNADTLSQAGVGPTLSSTNNPSTLSPYQNQAFGATAAQNQFQPAGAFTGTSASPYGSSSGGDSTQKQLEAILNSQAGQ